MITPGTKLGSYEILARIGAGGMGEVFRARDSKLGRDVAIKVLPAGFVHDAARMARFGREAKLLAALNHTNIASIYGLENSDGTQALIMELAEGPTLADKTRQGPLPMEDVLKIARQICDALEYAHERGIIHRDLKPANVKVAADDTVKILDFGLAKAMENEAASADISTSPTISRMATEQGILLGTAAYMAPEQAKGKPVDRRADIWAFGCVLYEMLTGKMAFAGETATDVLAAVLKNEPDFSKLPAGTPIRVRVLLQRCLQKDPKQRLRDIGDARGITHLKEGTMQVWPDFLPGGEAVLFRNGAPDKLVAQSIRTGERRDMLLGRLGNMPRYASSGHLIYAQAGSLMAVPFDLQRLEASGTAIQVLQGVLQSSGVNPTAQYTISARGSLAYVPGGLVGNKTRLVWVSRNGAEQLLSAPVRSYDQPRLSPDGRQLAVNISGNDGSTQIGLYDTARNVLSQFTFDGDTNVNPTWTPDGKRIAYASGKDGGLAIFWKPADGSGGLERLTDTTGVHIPFSWSPDSQQMAFVSMGVDADQGIWVLGIGKTAAGTGRDSKTQAFLKNSEANGVSSAQFSPDGRWMLYDSEESGHREIYVKPYPGPGGKWQISTDGGTEPMWNPNGREIFYRTGDKMMAVEISTQPGFVAAPPREIFEDTYLKNINARSRANYDVSPDGQRFLMVKSVEEEQSAQTQINIVLNWTEELKRLVPTGNQ